MTEIKTIDINAFRGIPNLQIDLGGKNLILKGENGTGKSSIVEALEFFFTGTMSLFHGESTQSLSFKKHAPHKDFHEDDVKISITFNPGTKKLERTFNRMSDIPDEFKDYFSVAQRGTFQLRRAQILKFLFSLPADRFRAIASLIGIEKLDEIELQMKRVFDHYKAIVQNEAEKLEHVFERMGDLLNVKITDTVDILPEINKTLVKKQITPIKSLEDIENATKDVLRSLSSSEDLEKVRIINQIIGSLKQEIIMNQSINEIRELNSTVESIIEDPKNYSDIQLVDLLEKGQVSLTSSDRDYCPLCGQNIERDRVLKDIKERLGVLSQLSEDASAIRRSSTSLRKDFEQSEKKLRDISSIMKEIEKFTEHSIKFEMKADALKQLIVKFEEVDYIKDTFPLDDIIEIKTELDEMSRILIADGENQIVEMKIPQDWEEKLEGIRFLDQIKNRIEDHDIIQKSLSKNKIRNETANEIYSNFIITKKEKVNEVFKSISDDLDRYWSILHEDDPHKGIELSFLEGRRASSRITIESFGSTREDPRAYISEGHQDSLGLCIFLAFVKKFNTECNLIILDDVVSTVDSQHRSRICELLFTEFKDYQLIITTHDGIWYEQICAYQRATKIEGLCRNLEIIRWTQETGPFIEPFKPRIERIENYIHNSKKRAAGNESRQYLEWLLKELSESLQTGPPLYKRSGLYTVNEFYTPIKSRIENLIYDCPFKEDVKKKIINLDKTVIMGNLTSHDNMQIENVSIREVNDFFTAIQNINSAFLCPECGRFIQYYRDLAILRCGGKCSDPLEVRCN